MIRSNGTGCALSLTGRNVYLLGRRKIRLLRGRRRSNRLSFHTYGFAVANSVHLGFGQFAANSDRTTIQYGLDLVRLGSHKSKTRDHAMRIDQHSGGSFDSVRFVGFLRWIEDQPASYWVRFEERSQRFFFLVGDPNEIDRSVRKLLYQRVPL